MLSKSTRVQSPPDFFYIFIIYLFFLYFFWFFKFIFYFFFTITNTPNPYPRSIWLGGFCTCPPNPYPRSVTVFFCLLISLFFIYCITFFFTLVKIWPFVWNWPSVQSVIVQMWHFVQKCLRSKFLFSSKNFPSWKKSLRANLTLRAKCLRAYLNFPL